MSSQRKLSETKQRLLELRLEGRGKGKRGPSAEELRKPAHAKSFASPNQTMIWLLHHSPGQSSAYNLASSYIVEGSLDHQALETSLEQVVARHEILRCTYALEGEDLTQRVLRNMPVSIERRTATNETEAFDLARQFVRMPFELEKGPLFRLARFDWEDERQLLVLSIHHLIADEWSLRIFWSEIESFYKLQLGLEETKPSELVIQYSDFAYRKKEWLESDACRSQLQYWENVLRTPPSPIQLRTDFPFTSSNYSEGRLQSSSLSVEASRKLKNLAAEIECSMFTLLLLGYYWLLRRHADSKDMLIASPVTNRNRKETADLIGFFLNTIALRLNLDAGSTVREALEKIKSDTFEALENGDAPFDKVVERVKPERVPGRAPLAQTMFVFQRAIDAEPELDLPNCRSQSTLVETGASRFELTMFATESEDRINTMIEYRADLFNAATIGKLLSRYANLMTGIAENLDRPLFELPMLDQPEIEGLRRWEKGEELDVANIPFPHVTVLERATTRPAATAISYGSQNMSYSAVSSLATAIASKVIENNPPKGSAIGICIEKSPLAICAALGVLKSGNPYCFMDPRHPPTRIQAIAETSGAPLILASVEGLENLEEVSIPKIDIESEMPSLVENGPKSYPVINDEDTAYIIFTSGSTGKPKGVRISHDNLRNSNHARSSYYKQAPRAFLLIPSLTFDSSVAGIFWTLSSGGNLVIPSSEELRDPVALRSLIRRMRIDALLCVPSLYELLLDEGGSDLRSLETCIVAGESCPPKLVHKHFEVLPQANLYNEYGPTEATVWTSVHKCSREDGKGAFVPIGGPIANAETRLLDKDWNRVPPGDSGEIFIGGNGISPGYIGGEEPDAKRFVSLEAGQKFYRSGDYGRWNVNGELEFIGRDDGQLKIRGHRIESSEIETALQSHPAVEKAVVLAVANEMDSIPGIDSVIEQVGELRLTEMLDSIESETSARSSKREKFEITLKGAASDFISPPRKAQRDWLIGQALEEISDDLEHLDRIAKDFVRGKDHEFGSNIRDITDARLAKQEFMEDWQIPVMKEMSQFVAEKGGDVLEIGFGRGVSATMIQNIGVNSHTIVEMNDHSIEAHYKPWAEKFTDRDIRLFHCKWQDAVSDLGLFDGVFFHAFPMNESEFIKYVLESVTFAEHAFPAMASHLVEGGVFTYLTTEIDSLSRRHQRLLFQHFNEVAMKVVPVDVPEDTHDQWWAKSMVVVKAVK